jgi:pathogenesis-related protein 1
MRRSLSFLIGALLASPAFAGEPAVRVVHPSRLTAGEIREVMSRHNEVRHGVGVPPLTWSPELAEFAQAWADEIARTGKFEHRPREGEFANLLYGENLAAGFGPGYGVATAVEHWRAEEAEYVSGTPVPELPEDFAQFKAGHYTQMVWRDTRSIGVGKAVIQTGDMAGWTVYVANYDPPGNAGGRKPY